MTDESLPHAAAALANVVVVLDEPQDVVNIAGVVRAMMNMGLSQLRLVNPAEFDTWRIEGIAHRSDEITAAARVFATLDEAIADARFVVGATARARTAERNYMRPREVAPEIVARAQGGTVAILFGREDRGLSNRALDRCHRAVVIPTDPRYRSLNLAQAFLVLAYEVFLATGRGEAPLPKGRRATRPATHAELEEMFGALDKGLAGIDFFKARKPESVLRTLRTVLTRSQLSLRESRLFRAIGFEIGNYLERLGRPPRSGTRADPD